MPRNCLLLSVKDEGPDLLEWALYHRLIGFDHILVYSNDCSDGSDVLLDALQGLGWLTHRRHHLAPGQSAQDAVAARAIADPALDGADWLMWLDADEFLVVHVGGRRVGDLIAAARGAEALALNWRNFGDGGHAHSTDDLVTERFTYGMTLDNAQSRSVKTLFRLTPRIAEFSIHRPIFTPGDPIGFRDGGAKPLGHAFQFGRNKNDRARHRVPEGRQNWQIGQINHYPIKALDRYLLKRQRGRGIDQNIATDRFDPGYLDIFNFNQIRDLAIQADLPALKIAMADALGVHEIADAYAACRALHAARLALVAPQVVDLLPDRYRRGGPPPFTKPVNKA